MIEGNLRIRTCEMPVTFDDLPVDMLQEVAGWLTLRCADIGPRGPFPRPRVAR